MTQGYRLQFSRHTFLTRVSLSPTVVDPQNREVFWEEIRLPKKGRWKKATDKPFFSVPNLGPQRSKQTSSAPIMQNADSSKGLGMYLGMLLAVSDVSVRRRDLQIQSPPLRHRLGPSDILRMDADLAPLGIKVWNYLDNLLVCAQTDADAVCTCELSPKLMSSY